MIGSIARAPRCRDAKASRYRGHSMGDLWMAGLFVGVVAIQAVNDAFDAAYDVTEYCRGDKEHTQKQGKTTHDLNDAISDLRFLMGACLGPRGLSESSFPQFETIASYKTFFLNMARTVVERKTAVVERKTAKVERKTAVVRRKTAVVERKTAVTERKTRAVVEQKTTTVV